MVLNVSYVCLLHSRLVENYPIWILEDVRLIFEVVLSQFPFEVLRKHDLTIVENFV
jgi:hypothetical protein